jgi:hypothetical protein
MTIRLFHRTFTLRLSVNPTKRTSTILFSVYKHATPRVYNRATLQAIDAKPIYDATSEPIGPHNGTIRLPVIRIDLPPKAYTGKTYTLPVLR